MDAQITQNTMRTSKSRKHDSIHTLATTFDSAHLAHSTWPGNVLSPTQYSPLMEVLLNGMVIIPDGRFDGIGPYVPSVRPKKRRCVRGVAISLQCNWCCARTKAANLKTMPSFNPGKTRSSLSIIPSATSFFCFAYVLGSSPCMRDCKGTAKASNLPRVCPFWRESVEDMTSIRSQRRIQQRRDRNEKRPTRVLQP